VSPEGRISPGDAGLWEDGQIEPLQRDDPHWAYHAAKKLGVEQPSRVLPPPYGHWLKR
jgi:hypothetical protein